MTIWHDLQREFRHGNNLTKIIFINIGVFVTINMLQVITWLITGNSDSVIFRAIMNNIQTYISVPDILSKPWTLLTYMFTHIDIMHILFNMLLLYWMGRIFIDMLNGKRFIAIYILGGISGAIFTVIVYHIFPTLSQTLSVETSMIGASASVLAITAATATYFPDYKIFIPFIGEVRLKYLALAMIVIDIILIRGDNSGGHIAHLGGALFGCIWAIKMKQNVDISKWFLSIMATVETWFKPRKNIRVTYKNTDTKQSTTVNETQKKQVLQAEIDVVLDKIAKNGYESLSAKEKEILFTMSNKK